MVTQKMVLDLLKKFSIFDSTAGKLRAGRLRDGGYVIPDDYNDLEGVLSFGVGDDVSFDSFFAEKGFIVFQYDHTVSEAPIKHKNFIFNENGLGKTKSGKMVTIDDVLFDNVLTTNDLVLKFDIEGSEWDALSGVSSELFKRFRFIVCELHWIHKIEDDLIAFENYNKVVDSLTTHHNVIHFHANNYSEFSLYKGIPLPGCFEITLLRKDRAQFFPSFSKIPSSLDFPNNPGVPDIVLTPYFSFFYSEDSRHIALYRSDVLKFIDSGFSSKIGTSQGLLDFSSKPENTIEGSPEVDECDGQHLPLPIPMNQENELGSCGTMLIINPEKNSEIIQDKDEICSMLRRRLAALVKSENSIKSHNEDLQLVVERLQRNCDAAESKRLQIESEKQELELSNIQYQAELKKMHESIDLLNNNCNDLLEERNFLHRLISEVCNHENPELWISQYFDEDKYLNHNGDVKEAILNGKIFSGLRHWLNHGVSEGRPVYFCKITKHPPAEAGGFKPAD